MKKTIRSLLGKIVIILLILMFFLTSCVERTCLFLVIDKEHTQSSAGGMCTLDIPEHYWIFLKNTETDKVYRWDNFAVYYLIEKGNIIEIHQKGMRPDLDRFFDSTVKSWKVKNQE